MIYSNVVNERIDLLNQVKRYLDENDVSMFENGSYEIDGNAFFVNIFEYDTKKEDECIWEAHRKYYDVHYIISGEEIIKVGFVDMDRIESYDQEKDYVALSSIEHSCVLCRPGDLLFLDEKDSHMTGNMVNGCISHVRKAVFKIRIQ